MQNFIEHIAAKSPTLHAIMKILLFESNKIFYMMTWHLIGDNIHFTALPYLAS